MVEIVGSIVKSHIVGNVKVIDEIKLEAVNLNKDEIKELVEDPQEELKVLFYPKYGGIGAVHTIDTKIVIEDEEPSGDAEK